MNPLPFFLPSARWLVAAVICLTTWHAHPVHAHTMPQSAVMLDFDRDDVAAQLILPLQDLSFAVKLPLLDDQAGVIPKHGPMLKEYILDHVHPVSPDGKPWTVEIVSLIVKSGELVPDLTAHLLMRPPPGEPLRQFTLNYDAILREVPSHKTFVFIRNDWNAARFRPAGQMPPLPEALGLLRYLVYSVPVDRMQGSFWTGFLSVLQLGMTHITGGLDHLLFLFVLLLPAPLLAVGHRWGGFRGLKPSFVQLLKIVTAFTIGHSLTLIIGSLGWVRLPQRPVEILIAVSILVSAIHAIRPFFAGREPWVAGGFGLVHGMAFSSAIAEFGFSPWHLAMTVLAFNLGIEVMQLIIVLMVVPTLILLSRSGTYTPLRVVGASLAALAALAWIGERLDFRTPAVPSAVRVSQCDPSPKFLSS